MRISSLQLMLEKAMMAEPMKPVARNMMIKNATPEAIRDRVNNGSRSIAIISDEAGNVFDSQTMRDQSIFTDGYSTAPILVDRKTSPSFVVKNYAMTVLLMGQEPVMRNFMARKNSKARGNGLLSRCFILYPKSTRGYKFLDNHKKSAKKIEAFQKNITELLGMYQLEIDAESGHSVLNQKIIRLSPEAENLFMIFNNQLQLLMQPGHFFCEDRDLASRAAENASRLACIFHVFEHGPNGEISADTFDRAATISLWFLHQSKRILHELSRPLAETDAQLLYDWLVGEYRNFQILPGQFMPGHIPERHRMPISHIYLNCRPNRLRNKSVLMPAIQALVDRGIVRHITKPKPAYLWLEPIWFNTPNLNVANCPIVAPPAPKIFGSM